MDHNEVRRIGVLGPPTNIALERELPVYLPPNVAMNYNRLSRPEVEMSKDSLLTMAASVDRAARDLAYALPEVIAYGCTSGSFLEGSSNQTRIADRITALTGIPAFTTSVALLEALSAMNVSSVYMVTPYPDDINEHEMRFFEDHHFHVAGYDSFRCAGSADLRAIKSDEVANLILSHLSEVAAVDAVLVSCTNMLVLDQIERLEKILDKPVVTSNQATLWAALKRLNIPTETIVCGRLFQH